MMINKYTSNEKNVIYNGIPVLNLIKIGNKTNNPKKYKAKQNETKNNAVSNLPW